MELSTEQKRALDFFKAGYNLFLTGPGGTGKTYIIRLMNAYANAERKKIQVCKCLFESASPDFFLILI